MVSEAAYPVSMRQVKPVRNAAIQGYCAQSALLKFEDVTWGETGGSSSRLGRRHHIAVHLTHIPTGVQVTLTSEAHGGRTRLQAKQTRFSLYLQALQELEQRVKLALKEARRAEFR